MARPPIPQISDPKAQDRIATMMSSVEQAKGLLAKEREKTLEKTKPSGKGLTSAMVGGKKTFIIPMDDIDAATERAPPSIIKERTPMVRPTKQAPPPDDDDYNYDFDTEPNPPTPSRNRIAFRKDPSAPPDTRKSAVADAPTPKVVLPKTRQPVMAETEEQPAPQQEQRRGLMSGASIPSIVAASPPAGFIRVNMPSACIPYTFDSVFLKPFDIHDLANVVAASEAGSYSLMIDALSACVKPDIRSLTSGDLRYVMLWLRLNSYAKSPYTISWTSRYGTSMSTSVSDTDLKVEQPKMTKAECLAYKAKGIRFPTVRDVEALSLVTDEDPKLRFLLERAQFVALPDDDDPGFLARAAESEEVRRAWFEDRLATLESKDISFLEDIREFSAKMNHGIVETISVYDDKVKAEDAIKNLRDTAIGLMAAGHRLAEDTGNPESILIYSERARQLSEEADEIEALIAKGGTFQAREETVTLAFETVDYFPEI